MDCEVETFEAKSFSELGDLIDEYLQPSKWCRRKVCGISHTAAAGYYTAIIIVSKDYE